jgi:hypothetical protein
VLVLIDLIVEPIADRDPFSIRGDKDLLDGKNSSLGTGRPVAAAYLAQGGFGLR